MQGPWRVIAVFLLVATVAALPGLQALTSAAAQSGPHHHPAGCHNSPPAVPAVPAAPAAPASTPSSYQCCVNGHHLAVPSASFLHRPLVAQLDGVETDEPLRLGGARNRHSATFVVSSISPPNAGPLRV